MQRIHKYPLTLVDVQYVEMPTGARPISVQNQNGQLCMWVIVDPELALLPRRVRVVETGQDIVNSAGYVGTVLMDDAKFVCHVFVDR